MQVNELILKFNNHAYRGSNERTESNGSNLNLTRCGRGRQEKQQSLILLGEVGYIHHTMPFGLVKDKNSDFQGYYLP